MPPTRRVSSPGEGRLIACVDPEFTPRLSPGLGRNEPFYRGSRRARVLHVGVVNGLVSSPRRASVRSKLRTYTAVSRPPGTGPAQIPQSSSADKRAGAVRRWKSRPPDAIYEEVLAIRNGRCKAEFNLGGQKLEKRGWADVLKLIGTAIIVVCSG